MVSFPLPVRSIYQNVLSSITPKYCPPFGETLMWPEAARGAEAMKKSFCFRIHSMMCSGMVSQKTAISQSACSLHQEFGIMRRSEMHHVARMPGRARPESREIRPESSVFLPMDESINERTAILQQCAHLPYLSESHSRAASVEWDSCSVEQQRSPTSQLGQPCAAWSRFLRSTISEVMSALRSDHISPGRASA